MRRVVRIKAMQGLYTYFNNKGVNLTDIRQKVFLGLIEVPQFYEANPMEKSGFQALLPVLLDEAFENRLSLNELPENQKWLGRLALDAVQDWNRENEKELGKIRKQAHQDLRQQKAAEVSFWQLFVGLIEHVQTEEDRRRNQYLNNEPSADHELKILQHPYLPRLMDALHPPKRAVPLGCFQFDEELQSRIFSSLFRNLPEYRKFKEKETVSPEDEEGIFKVLYRKLFKLPEFNEACLEQNLHWSENKVLLEVNLKSTFRDLSEGKVPDFSGDPEELDEICAFFDMLLDSSIRNFEEYEAKISSVAENWHNDRVALLDKWIIHLSLNEMVAFPHIPMKVTMNEYLEIAKGYSTPNSAAFINGVVDKIAKEMGKTGVIRKSARGLMDNR